MVFFHELSRPKLGPEGRFGGSGTETTPSNVPGGMLVLTLDDVLARVPTRALKPGLHDPSRRLHFAMEELLEGISRGRATIMLSKLAERYPETFEPPAPGAEDTPIYLPLQKLIQQIGRATRKAPEKAPPTVAARAPKAAEPPPADAPIPEVPPSKPLRRLRVMADPVDLTSPPAEPVVAKAAALPVEPPSKKAVETLVTKAVELPPEKPMEQAPKAVEPPVE